MKYRRIMLGVAAIVVALALSATASARSPLHGSLKIKIVRQTWHNPHVTNHQILHCMGGYRSTARRNWADWYFTGYTNQAIDPGCRAAAGDGLAIVKLEHGVWTAVTENSGARPCYLKSYPGQPRIPWAVIDDLFRIHCPTNGFGSP
jgi:hypothetical protein